MDFSQRFRANNNIILREEDDGAFLFDPKTGNLKYINRSAKDTFLLLNRETEVSQMIDHLFSLYSDVDREQIQKDVESFLMELVENRFISPCEGE